jgi:hypothetical protein
MSHIVRIPPTQVLPSLVREQLCLLPTLESVTTDYLMVDVADAVAGCCVNLNLSTATNKQGNR